MDVIGDRWTLVLIRHLLEGPRRFQELRMRTGIAPRVLSSRLRRLAAHGFLEKAGAGPQPAYHLSDRGRTFEPVINAVARWFLLHGIEHLDDPGRFSATSATSILESLPFLLREERARDTNLTFEVRLSGTGGGVWTVRIEHGRCTVRESFAEKADVRYTADARVWCAVALGLVDAKDVYRQGLMTKDGGREAMDYYFDQIVRARKGGRSKRRRRSAG